MMLRTAPSRPRPLTIPAKGPYRLLNASVPVAMLNPQEIRGRSADFEGLCAVDIDVTGDGMIGKIQPSCQNGTETACTDGLNIDLGGRVVMTRLAELHAHIDKTQSWERAPNLDGTYNGAKSGAKSDRINPWTDEDVYTRMSFALECAYAHGTRSLRTHIDSQKKRTQPSWRIFDQLRREWAGKITLQGVISLGVGKIMGKYGHTIARHAAEYNACFGPVIYNSENQHKEIIRSFELAEQYNLPLDFHVDETLNPLANGLGLIAQTALERGFSKPIICGHVCSLSMKDEEEIASILGLVKQAGIGLIAMPMSNLYLQDRSKGAPLFRGCAPMRDIHKAGVALAIGGDNCRDAFHPYGDYDMVEVYREAVRIGHLDNTIGHYANTISSTPERLMGLSQSARLAKGHFADMIIFQGTSFSQIFTRIGAPRSIICNGRMVDAPLPPFPNLDF